MRGLGLQDPPRDPEVATDVGDNRDGLPGNLETVDDMDSIDDDDNDDDIDPSQGDLEELMGLFGDVSTSTDQPEDMSIFQDPAILEQLASVQGGGGLEGLMGMFGPVKDGDDDEEDGPNQPDIMSILQNPEILEQLGSMQGGGGLEGIMGMFGAVNEDDAVDENDAGQPDISQILSMLQNPAILQEFDSLQSGRNKKPEVVMDILSSNSDSTDTPDAKSLGWLFHNNLEAAHERLAPLLEVDETSDPEPSARTIPSTKLGQNVTEVPAELGNRLNILNTKNYED